MRNPKTGRPDPNFSHRCRSVRHATGKRRDSPRQTRIASTKLTVRYCRTQQYSITALTDSLGTIQERYAYDAYGNLSIFDASGVARTSTAESNRYTCTGLEWDEEFGIYHFRGRMYDSVCGRFLSRDPIGYWDGNSLYQNYFQWNGMDPSGTRETHSVTGFLGFQSWSKDGYVQIDKIAFKFSLDVGCNGLSAYLNNARIDWDEYEWGRASPGASYKKGPFSVGWERKHEVKVRENNVTGTQIPCPHASTGTGHQGEFKLCWTTHVELGVVVDVDLDPVEWYCLTVKHRVTCCGNCGPPIETYSWSLTDCGYTKRAKQWYSGRYFEGGAKYVPERCGSKLNGKSTPKSNSPPYSQLR